MQLFLQSRELQQVSTEDTVAPDWLPLAVFSLAYAAILYVALRVLCHLCLGYCSCFFPAETGSAGAFPRGRFLRRILAGGGRFVFLARFMLSASFNFLVLYVMQRDYDTGAILILSLALFGFVVNFFLHWSVMVPFRMTTLKDKIVLEAQNVYEDLGSSSMDLNAAVSSHLGMAENEATSELIISMKSNPFPSMLSGFGQIALMVMYGLGIYSGGRPDFSSSVVYGYYWFASLVVASYVTGRDFWFQFLKSTLYWVDLFAAVRKEGALIDGRTGKRVEFGYLWVRHLLSLISNVFGFIVVYLGLPVQLSRSENEVEFVLNAVAAFIVVELDDRNAVEPITLLLPSSNKGVEGAANNGHEEHAPVVGDPVTHGHDPEMGDPTATTNGDGNSAQQTVESNVQLQSVVEKDTAAGYVSDSSGTEVL